jgi:hypothetical protein
MSTENLPQHMRVQALFYDEAFRRQSRNPVLIAIYLLQAAQCSGKAFRVYLADVRRRKRLHVN